MSARRGDACVSCGGDRADAPREGCKYPPNHARAMSEPYTPTTEEVRAWAVLASPLTEAEFDAWLASVKAKAWDEGATAEARGAGFEPALELNPYREGGDPRRERPAVRTTVEWGIKALFDRGTILPKPAEHALDAVRRFPEDWALVRRTVTDWTQVHP